MTFSLKPLLQRFWQLQGAPIALARGTAVGVFTGILPLTPLRTILNVTLTVPARSSTVAAILTCTLVCNPFTILPCYYVSWLIGTWLFPGRLSWIGLQAAVQQMQQAGLIEAFRIVGTLGLDAILVLLTGGTLLALPLAVVSYPFALRFFRRIEQVRHEKHLLNKQSGQAGE